MAKKIGFAAMSKADREKMARKGGKARAKQVAANKPVVKKAAPKKAAKKAVKKGR